MVGAQGMLGQAGEHVVDEWAGTWLTLLRTIQKGETWLWVRADGPSRGTLLEVSGRPSEVKGGVGTGA